MPNMFNELPAFVQVIAIVSLVAGISVIILDEFKASGAYSSTVNDTIDDGIAGIAEITSWLDLIALIVAASIIMYLVLRNFGVIGGTGGGGAY